MDVERPDHLPPLCDAAVTLASRGRVTGILALTHEGRTARLLSSRRPDAPIFAVTDREDVARRLCLWWGVTPIVDASAGGRDAALAELTSPLRARGLLPAAATLVIVRASPDLTEDGANFVKIRRV